MIKIFTINILLIFSLQSCSTTSVDSNSIPLSSKTLTYSSIGCIVIGLLSGLLARKYSPNKESEGANLALFGVSGCVIGGAATGYINHLKEREDYLKDADKSEYLYQNHATPVRMSNE